MTTREALLQSIFDNPEDDSVRLIYADWLEENGQPERADFIRIQIELAKAGLSKERQGELRSREQALLETHRQKWDEELPADLRSGFYERGLPLYRGARRPTFGLPGGWIIPEDLVWLGTGPSFDSRVAAVDSVLAELRRHNANGLRIDSFFCPNYGKRPRRWLAHLLAGLPPGLRGLDIGPHFQSPEEEADFEVLANAPNLSELTTLLVRASWATPATVRALAYSPFLRGLTTLRLKLDGYIWEGREAMNEGVAILASSSNLRSVRRLSLIAASAGLGPLGAWGLLTSEHLDQVEELELSLDPLLPVPMWAALRQRFGQALLVNASWKDRLEGVKSRLELAKRREDRNWLAADNIFPGYQGCRRAEDWYRLDGQFDRWQVGAAAWSAVCRHPRHDAPRLAYADWLERQAERGIRLSNRWEMTDRAELIRAQCRLARLSADDPGRPELKRWVLFLLEDGGLGDAELEGLPLPAGFTWGGYERGFITGVQVGRPELAPHLLPALVRLTPLEHLEVGGAILDGSVAEALAVLRPLEQFHTLKLSTYAITTAAARILAEAPVLIGLNTLDIRGCRLEPEAEWLLCNRFVGLLR
jgi:uncharacterized protein (TIGR02996 family)